jgi:hypothetical protein
MTVRGPQALLAACTWGVLVAAATLDPPARAFQVLALMGMLAALGWTGARLARRLLPAEGLLTRILCAASVAVALLTGLATALGHCGALRPGLFLLLVAMIFAAGLLLPGAPAIEAANGPADGAADDGAADAPARPGSAAPPQPRTPFRPRLGVRLERGLLLAAVLALGGALAVESARMIGRPEGFYGPDDVSYHLPAVAVWRRFADLRMIKPAVGDRSTAFYPIAPELGAWSLLAPLRDSDAAARRSQLPFALLSLVAVAALARRLELDRRTAALAVLTYAMFERAFPMLAWTAGSDHEAACFTLVALDGALLLLRRPSRGAAAYTGIGLGLLLASKYTGLYFAATVVAVLLVGIAGRWFHGPRGDAAEDRAAAGDLPWQLAILALMALATGGYTYLRNAWTMGNPVFPAPVQLFGHTLLPGWKEATLAWRRHLPEFRIAPVDFLTRRPDVFGPLFPYTVLAGALLAPLALLRRRALLPVLVAALPAILFLEFLLLMHDHREGRYLFAALALGSLDLAWLLARQEIGWVAVLRAVLLVALLHLGCRRLGLRLGWEIALLLVALAAAVFSRPSPRWRHLAALRSPRGAAARWAMAVLGLAAILLAARPLGAAVERYQARKLRGDPAAMALEQAITGAIGANEASGARVAYAGANQPYLFFGSHLQNDVEIVPRTWDLAAQYYRWGGPPEFPYDDGNRRRWRRILDDLKIEYVVAVRTPEEGPERGWLAADPRGYQALYDDGRTAIWRVVRE